MTEINWMKDFTPTYRVTSRKYNRIVRPGIKYYNIADLQTGLFCSMNKMRFCPLLLVVLVRIVHGVDEQGVPVQREECALHLMVQCHNYKVQ